MNFEEYMLNEDVLTEARFEHHSDSFGRVHTSGFEGKKVGTTPAGHHIISGHDINADGSKGALKLHIVHPTTHKIIATHSPHDSDRNNEQVHKAAIKHAKSGGQLWSSRESHKSFHLRHQSFDNDHLRPVKKDK